MTHVFGSGNVSIAGANLDHVRESRLLIKDGGGSEARVWKSAKLCKAGKVLVDVWKPPIEAWEELERLVDIGRPLFETWQSLTMLIVIWAPLFETQESSSRLIEASKPPINALEGWGLEATFQDTRRLIKVGTSSYINLGNLSKSGKGSCRCLEAFLEWLVKAGWDLKFCFKIQKGFKSSNATVWDLGSSARLEEILVDLWKSPFET